MKNQNDLIVSIAAFFVMAIVIGVSWGTQRTPNRPQPPVSAVTAAAPLPTAAVVMADSLPQSSGSGGAASGGAGKLTGGMAGPSSRIIH